MEEKRPMELEEATALFAGCVKPCKESERISLWEAGGRILAEEVMAGISVPSFPKSAMDGYAVRAEDTAGASPEKPVELAVMGESLAGVPYGSGRDDLPESLTAVRIMTGAPVPEGYDSVVRQEDTDYGETRVKLYKEVTPYTNYCRVGEDIMAGQTVLSAGRRIGRVEAGILASLGISQVTVIRPLRVAILSTGTELREPGQPLPEGGIYNSIAYTLSVSLQRAGFRSCFRICPDDADAIAKELLNAKQEADVIITTGGVSVGVKDLLPEALERIGARRLFSGVNVQPGTPTIGSISDDIPILSLSGNPYAALVNFDQYFWPVAAKLTGCDAFLPIREEAVLRSEYPKKNRLRRMIRAKAENGEVTLPVKSHASSVLSNLSDCNCYIDLPAGRQLQPGDRVQILRMPE